MGNDMVDKISAYDAEKILRSMVMEWHEVSSKCIDWKLKTSRTTKHKQDMFGVFDCMLNDKNHITIGYQFKYWSKDMTPAQRIEWAAKVRRTNFDTRNAYLVILIHTTSQLMIYNAHTVLTQWESDFAKHVKKKGGE